MGWLHSYDRLTSGGRSVHFHDGDWVGRVERAQVCVVTVRKNMLTLLPVDAYLSAESVRVVVFKPLSVLQFVIERCQRLEPPRELTSRGGVPQVSCT